MKKLIIKSLISKGFSKESVKLLKILSIENDLITLLNKKHGVLTFIKLS